MPELKRSCVMPSEPQDQPKLQPVLQIRELSKTFRIYAKPIDRLKEAFSSKSFHQTHQALSSISFDLLPGQALGLIGQNGAGKSTLLKLISGVLDPDSGSVTASGRIAGLLELGTGFDPEATGRENIAINGHLLGLSSEEIESITPQVIEFAELGPFIDTPIRTYSSGMQMRLGFSIAFHSRPKAFVVDEALSVGDARFQQRCMQKIREYKASGGALLFVSHDLNAIRLLCDQAMVLHQGRLMFHGAPEEAVRVYYKTLAGSDNEPDSHSASGQDLSTYGRGEVVIESLTWAHAARTVEISSDRSSKAPSPGSAHASITVSSGDPVQLQLAIRSEIAFSASVGILIRDRFGQDIFGINTAMLELPVEFAPGQSRTIAFDLSLAMAPGRYTLTVAVHTDTSHVHNCQHWWDNALEFEVIGFSGKPFSGVSRLDHRVSLISSEGLRAQDAPGARCDNSI
ncbi:MAG: ABC transporter ATP-binding protein [Burkholderiaceae bacterium]|nr:ABC transporter ATP-binding protein [Burkholderiaceae bacterium]